MRKYAIILLTLLLFVIPLVHANAFITPGKHYVFLDGELLKNFRLSILSRECGDDPYNYSAYQLPENESNCTYVHRPNDMTCTSNPCDLYMIYSTDRLLLEADGKRIITPSISTRNDAVYNVYFTSDGTVSSAFSREFNSHDFTGQTIFIIILYSIFLAVPIIIINALIETGIGYLYFKKKKMPYKKLWWIVLANAISYVLFVIFLVITVTTISLLLLVVIAELLIILGEALFYKPTLKLPWKDVLLLSLFTNAVTIIVGVIVSVLFG